MDHRWDERCLSSDEVGRLRRRIADLEQANERLQEQLRDAGRSRDRDTWEKESTKARPRRDAGAEELRALFHAAAESILLVDRDGAILTLNRTAAQRLGHSVDEMIGRRLAEVALGLIPPEVAARRAAAIREVFDTGRAVQLDDERGGISFDLSMCPVIGTDGRVTSVAIFAQDVTEKRRTQEQIKTLQQQTEFILGAAKTGLNITDGDFNLRYVDSAWQKVYGSYEGKKCYEYFRGADRPCEVCGIPRALATRQIVTYDSRLPKEGNRPIQVTTIPFQAQSGEWLVAEVNVDIAEREALEEKLRDSEQRYRTLVETAGETIAVVDAEGVFRFMNTTAARRLGGRPDDFLGKTMWELFPREVADAQMAHIRGVISSSQGQTIDSVSHVRGEPRWYCTTVEPLRDPGGRVAAALVIARDIHELKTAQQELETYREKVMRAEHLASLGTLSAVLSHEMTQPLTVLRLSLQNALKILPDGGSASLVREDLEEGLVEVVNLAGLARRFRDFARRTTDLTVAEVSLSGVARKVLRLLEDDARQARLTMEVQPLEDLPPIRACGKDLEQVFFALAQNAIHAADGSRDHWFRVRGACRHDGVELRFEDDCGGIPPEIQDRLFEPFVTTKPPGQGTGLGLCLVQRIVSQAGGGLEVQSEWGRGTTFFISWPTEPRGPESSD
jgi:PAS domain S-box-containing protein